MLNYIQNVLIPPAINLLQAALKVVPLSKNITIDTDTTCSGEISTPSIYKTEGVAADLVLFITTSNDASSNYVAAAEFCSLSLENSRPLVGKLNYNLYYFSPTTKDVTIESHVYTTIHEMTHALGFSSSLFSSYIDPTTNQPLTGHVGTKTVNGGEVTYINLPSLTSRLRDHFNCSTLEGAYLENEGGSLSAGSHFERRIFFNEYMTASGIRDVKFTEFTLALLEGTGWYEADYTYAEAITYGKNRGCDFLDAPCVDISTETSAFPEFCSPLTAIQPYWTRRGVGVCGAQTLTTSNSLDSNWNYWQNDTVVSDAYSDNCPNVRIYTNIDCEDSSLQSSALLEDQESYGYGSKGFIGTLSSGKSPLSSVYGYCFLPKCTLQGNGDYELQVQIGSSWVTCENNAKINPPSKSGLSGKLNCPDANDFCNQITTEGNCRGGCFGRGSCVNQQCECEDGWGFHDCIKKTYTDNCERCAGLDPWRTSCYGETCECNSNNSTCMCELGLMKGSACTTVASESKPMIFIICGAVGGVIGVIVVILLVRFARKLYKSRKETGAEAKSGSYSSKGSGRQFENTTQAMVTIRKDVTLNMPIDIVDVEVTTVLQAMATSREVEPSEKTISC